MRDLGQIPAHQRKVVVFIHLPYGANARHDRLVPQVAAQRITGIGWIGEHAAGAYDGRGLSYQARLRISRVNGKELSHARNSF